MALYKLVQDPGSESSRLADALPSKIDVEARLEGWLEQSPGVLTETPCLWIGRQTSAHVADGTIFPDLLGLDDRGNLIVVELKRDRAPRDVIAQGLDYCSWAALLSAEEICRIAEVYWATIKLEGAGQGFEAVFRDYLDLVDEPLPDLNRTQRLFLVAEQFPESILRTSRYLRTSLGLDVSCVAFQAHETAGGEVLVSTDVLVGEEEARTSPGKPRASSARWQGEKSAKEVVREETEGLLCETKQEFFSLKEVRDRVLAKHPGFNAATVGCQITADCESPVPAPLPRWPTGQVVEGVEGPVSAVRSCEGRGAPMKR